MPLRGDLQPDRHRQRLPARGALARQVEAHGRPGDVLVLMSTSGRSGNLLAAARRGRRAGMQVWSMTGPLPNPLADLSDEHCSVEARYTATVQEMHLVALHIMCAAFDRELGVGVPAQVSTEDLEVLR
ncbi:SIS domain-containing protein [Nocardioides sp. WG-D5]